MSLLDELNDTFRVQAGKAPRMGLLEDYAYNSQPQQGAVSLPAPVMPELSAPNFNFSPNEQQNKQALFSSLANMGAAMLANNRGNFGQSLGHGLAAQQQGYRGALDRASDENVQQFRTGMLKDDWQAKQQERQRQAALRRGLSELPQGADYWKNAAELYASAGDMETALKLQEYGSGGKPTDAQRNYQFLVDNGVDRKQAMQVFTPFAPTPMQYVPPTETRPGGFVNPRTGERNFDEPPVPPKLKDVPADVLKKVGENKGALTNIDNLILSLKDEATRAEDPEYKGDLHLGAWNYLGDTVRQRTDPEGVPLRAAIANISGQVIHDRSGAAVTVGEMERLKPFLPAPTDDAATALKKAQTLRGMLGDEMRAYNSMFGADYGYKGLTPRGAPPAAAMTTAPVKAQAFGSLAPRSDIARQAKEQGISYQEAVSRLKAKGVRVE